MNEWIFLIEEDLERLANCFRLGYYGISVWLNWQSFSIRYGKNTDAKKIIN